MNTFPPDFVAYLRSLCEQSRSFRTAHRILLDRWHSGASIPGYGTAREWFTSQFPAAGQSPDLFTSGPIAPPRGWSRRNLAKQVLRSTSERRLLRAVRIFRAPTLSSVTADATAGL